MHPYARMTLMVKKNKYACNQQNACMTYCMRPWVRMMMELGEGKVKESEVKMTLKIKVCIQTQKWMHYMEIRFMHILLHASSLSKNAAGV